MFLLALVNFVFLANIVCGEKADNFSSQVTLITAYFDINRPNKNVSVVDDPRPWTVYLEYFKKWARIKNRLVVFCQNEEIKGRILSIRKEFGLEGKTDVIVINDVYSLESDIYKRMVGLAKDPYFLKMRRDPKKLLRENDAGYDYIQNLKTYFLQKSVLEYNITTDYVAWLDFGFDHGGETYHFEEDWSFELKCEPSDKVTMFYLAPKLDDRPIFEIIRTVKPDSMMGGFIIVPKALANELWLGVRKALYTILYAGMVDDDQPVYLLTARRNPGMFNLQMADDWFLPVKTTMCNGQHMRYEKSDSDKMKKSEKKIGVKGEL